MLLDLCERGRLDFRIAKKTNARTTSLRTEKSERANYGFVFLVGPRPRGAYRNIQSSSLSNSYNHVTGFPYNLCLDSPSSKFPQIATHRRPSPSLCFQHLPSTSENILLLKTGSRTRATPSGCVTGSLLSRRTLESASIEGASLPDTNEAFSRSVAYLFDLYLKNVCKHQSGGWWCRSKEGGSKDGNDDSVCTPRNHEQKSEGAGRRVFGTCLDAACEPKLSPRA